MEILEAAYNAAKLRSANHEALRAGRNGVHVSEIDTWPADCQITNDEHSAIELYEWLANPPDQYFVYISHEGYKNAMAGQNGDLGWSDRLAKDGVTTWTGMPLGNVRFGYPYKVPAFGGWPSERVSIHVYGNNGVHYNGTYYKSSGDYARIRKSKRVLCGPRKGQLQ